MKYVFMLVLLSSSLFCKVYYAKVEPYEIRNISSNVVGLVLFIDEDMIGKVLTSSSYLKIDSELDNKELKYIRDKLVYLQNTVKINKKVLKNLEDLLRKKRLNYEKIKSLKIKSVVEKDREFYDLVSSENQSLSTSKEIHNLSITIADLKLRKAHLIRSVRDKKLIAEGYMLYSLAVRSGQVVGIATPLAQVADISRAKLTLFLDEVDVKDAKTKKVYIDGKLSQYKVSRILNIADSKNISKYMAQIIIKSPTIFSKLVKIELK
ncbi:MAG: HlyD family secretion protein [Sulfurimonas sp.]|nr:MAG: HlyD family secretion protein [Sulfurimonas sp.]